MGNVYEQYEKNQAVNAKSASELRKEGLTLEDRVGAAMDQTELLQEVGRRVTAFVEAYERLNSLSLEEAKALRARPDQTERTRRIADNIELAHQQLYTQGHPGQSGFTALNLDDLKILLDQFPQGL